ncbi:scavenger receptor cysteine-rich type 1 protein M130-like isoform X2 [Corythoichthys intestinalis]|uniref:scavenger receptor cysteine-rich type 1 protein M130-like isoform X2 n=1 Tax=Corythoichthys intestinalis TaxID=161448 RepID=UPI0025A56418|nr:scavenger receptor cysteine-rich type 1 protein M130-like isoform X2 [Corythoichthys intestinalis]
MCQRYFVAACSVLLLFWSFHQLVTEVDSLKTQQDDTSQSNDPNDAHLTGGSGRCTGQLELKHQGKWRIANMRQETSTTVAFAQVACRQIDCGSFVSLQHKTTNDPQPFWEINFFCRGSESTLMECDNMRGRKRVQGRNSTWNILEVTCSDSLRVVDHDLCSGNLEVKTLNGWARVCEEGFDSQAKKQAQQTVKLGSLSQNYSVWPDLQEFRVMGGQSNCDGTVEGKDYGEWRPLGGYYWEKDHFSEVCKQLGCGSLISTSRHLLPKRQPVWVPDGFCGNGLCTEWRASRSDLLITVACSESVRLVDRKDTCSGNLMLKSAHTWESVCHKALSAEDALVVCRELGCGFPRDYQSRKPSAQDTQQRSPDFKCKGTEEVLTKCPSFTFNATEGHCGNSIFSCIDRPLGPHISVHSIHGEKKNELLKGHRFAIICRQLGPYAIHSFRLRKGIYTNHPSVWTEKATDNSAIFLFPALNDSHKGVYNCDFNFELSSRIFSDTNSLHLTVKELNDLRLRDGGSQCAGRLEVKHDQEWRPVSYQNNWSLREAAVVCQQLRCSSVVSTRKMDTSTEPVPVWRFYSDCEGSESALMDCGTVKMTYSSSIIEVVCAGVLPRPNITFFSGYTEEKQQETVNILKGYSFFIKCSVEPHYPHGHFSLNFSGLYQTFSQSQPAVNHSARFVFHTAQLVHTGNFTCVYHNFVFSQNFTSVSDSCSVTVEDELDLILDDGVNTDNNSISCSGKLFVRHEKELRMLSSESPLWDLKHASVVCRQLGCGAAVSTNATSLLNKQAVWRLFSDCDGAESALLDCSTVAPWFSSSVLVVTCAG